MKFHLLDFGYLKEIEFMGSDEKIIEAARMSTGKGFQGWGNSEKPGDEKLLKHLWVNQHTTPFEMGSLKIEVKAPILVFREWHRHRTQSFNEMSARYIPLPAEDYLPSIDRLLINSGKNLSNKQAGTVKGSEALTEKGAELFREALQKQYKEGQRIYEEALKYGVPKELARVHLPVGRYSVMQASANLLNWLKFCKLRQSANAQWEIRQYANALGIIIEQRFPRTYKLYLESRGF